MEKNSKGPKSPYVFDCGLRPRRESIRAALRAASTTLTLGSGLSLLGYYNANATDDPKMMGFSVTYTVMGAILAPMTAVAAYQGIVYPRESRPGKHTSICGGDSNQGQDDDSTPPPESSSI
jgi:hypothetical protein